MTLCDDVLPIIQSGWALVQDLGFSPEALSIVTRTWEPSDDPDEVRRGDPDETTLTIEPNPPVKFGPAGRVAGSSRDGGGAIVGPITPAHVSGGYTPEQLNPFAYVAPENRKRVEVVYILTGPRGTRRYELDWLDVSDPVGYMLHLTTDTGYYPGDG